MKITEEQEVAERYGLKGPMDRIRQKRKGERAYTNDEIAEHENLAAEIRAKLDDYQPERMRAALAALSGGAQCAALPRKLTAENGAKAALIGEFYEDFEYLDADNEVRVDKVRVSWDTIKRIWDAAVAHFDRNPVTEGHQPQPVAASVVEALERAQRIIERDYPNGQLASDIREVLAIDTAAPTAQPVALRDALRDLLEIEDARIATGAFTPNAEAQRRIDNARSLLASQPPAAPVDKTLGSGAWRDVAIFPQLPNPPASPIEACIRTFDTTGATLTRIGKVLTITCADDATANRVADQLRTEPHFRSSAATAIAALAKRFWNIHPKEIQDLGITREQFYEREMRALFAAITAARDTEGKDSLRTFDTAGTVFRRAGKILTITCEDDAIANRVADQLRTPLSSTNRA